MTRTLMPLAVIVGALVLSACDRIGVDKVDERGMTALMHAARRGDSAEVARLIATGADVNAEVPTRAVREIMAIATNEELPLTAVGFTPLLYATEGGRVRLDSRRVVVRQLIAAGADVHHETGVGETALRFAIRRSNDAELTRALIDAGARADQQLFKFAVEKSGPEIVALLLNGGADSATLAAADARPFAPLLIAATKRDDPAVVKLLVDAGFKVNARDRNGWTALRWARDAESGSTAPRAAAIAAMLEAAGARDDAGVKALPLFDAVLRNDLTQVRAALKAGANPNARDNASVPPLVHAADKGQAEIVSALIQAGAHVNMTPEFGATPLTAAIQNGSLETVRRLLAAGARGDQWDSKGMLPLTAAAIWSRTDVVALLLADSVNVDAQALWMAARKGDTAQVRMMLDHAPTMNTNRALVSAISGCFNSDNTAVIRMLLLRGASTKITLGWDFQHLHRAADLCSAVVVQLLLQHGEDPNRRGDNNTTPLMWASRSGKVENVRALIAAGADVHARDKDGKSALSWARHSDVQQELRKAGARSLVGR